MMKNYKYLVKMLLLLHSEVPYSDTVVRDNLLKHLPLLN